MVGVELVLKILAGLVCCWLALKFILKNAPPETDNKFKKKPKEKLKQLPKPTSGVKYLYRLARASESSRTGNKGTRTTNAGEHDTVGWEAADMARRPLILRASDGGYYGVAGLDDDCLHLSTAAQVRETARLYFKGVEELLLLKFSTEMIEKSEIVELRWEAALPPPGQPARDDAFPHCYSRERGIKARLSWWDLVACIPLPLGDDGEPTFPPDALSEDNVELPSALPSTLGVAAPKASAAASAPEEPDELTKLEEELRKEMLAEGQKA